MPAYTPDTITLYATISPYPNAARLEQPDTVYTVKPDTVELRDADGDTRAYSFTDIALMTEHGELDYMGAECILSIPSLTFSCAIPDEDKDYVFDYTPWGTSLLRIGGGADGDDGDSDNGKADSAHGNGTATGKALCEFIANLMPFHEAVPGSEETVSPERIEITASIDCTSDDWNAQEPIITGYPVYDTQAAAVIGGRMVLCSVFEASKMVRDGKWNCAETECVLSIPEIGFTALLNDEDKKQVLDKTSFFADMFTIGVDCAEAGEDGELAVAQGIRRHIEDSGIDVAAITDGTK